MTRFLLILCLTLGATSLFANKVVNVYIWGGEIPKQLIQDFENETGITVNLSTYDSNETMYAKLKASGESIYDVILPSAYFVERMRNQGMLTALDHKLLPNLVNIDKQFIDSEYDPGNHYSAPLLWGATGIFYNQTYVKDAPTTWQDLWQNRWRKQLMLLDDSREAFSIALMSLGFNPNDKNPQHIEQAYQRLLELVPNIKLFASDSIQAIMIDEDAIAGIAWNGDAFKAQAENKQVNFKFPDQGFVIWIDCLAIPINPPHLQEAYEFINFMFKPESSVKIALLEGAAITNINGRALLPKTVNNNRVVYPSEEILNHAYLQRDPGEETLALYNKYWQQFKLAF